MKISNTAIATLIFFCIFQVSTKAQIAKDNYDKNECFEVGKYHHVEIGMEERKIRFKVDGKKVFKVKDEAYYKGVKVILRVRGMGHELESCIIKM